ncbi:MAG: sugar ABC transporter permease [Tetrasphaera sp.]
MTQATAAAAGPLAHAAAGRPARKKSTYPYYFLLLPALIYFIFFILPTLTSFYYSFTRWDLFTAEWIGLDNYRTFFQEQALLTGLKNTLIYAVITSGLKVVLGLGLAMLLTSKIIAKGYLRSVIFFPVLVSSIGIGLTFTILMNPERGLINSTLGTIGIGGPGWLTDPNLALYSVAIVDIWKGVGLATVIFIAGLVSIPGEYYEAAALDGANKWQTFRNIMLPLSRPAMASVITLSFIGGLRSFDLIWAMTKGGPGFASDVLASVIYKQYQAGFYGLSTAGNVVLFLLVTIIMVPLTRWLNRAQEA